MTPRFTIKIKCFEKPGYAPLIEIVVKERTETVYVATGADLETVFYAARAAIAECEGVTDEQ